MKTSVKGKSLSCPNCGSSLNVDELLVSQFRDSIKADLQEELEEREAELQNQKEELEELSAMFENEKLEIEKRIQDQVRMHIQTKEKMIKKEIRLQIEEEQSIQVQELEDELIRKSNQLKSMNRTKAELTKLRLDFEEQEAIIVLRKEQELNERLENAKEFIRASVEQENLLKLREKEKLIDDLKGKLNEAKRKIDQGSMQIQGEVQELEIQNVLQQAYPYDEITQNKKGQNGADILQTVKTHKGVEIGSIYYESKRTQAYSERWIPKFKLDNLSTKADILVLVTQVLPKGIEKYGVIDDVWVCDINYVKELSLVLRYGLLKVYSVVQHQHKSKDKSELLYRYITSREFQNIFESIITGFKNIQDSHTAEQLKLKRMWLQREKQLNQILSNLIEHYSSLQDITENSITEIKLLEFMSEAA